jgi:hypothetical protein
MELDQWQCDTVLGISETVFRRQVIKFHRVEEVNWCFLRHLKGEVGLEGVNLDDPCALEHISPSRAFDAPLSFDSALFDFMDKSGSRDTAYALLFHKVDFIVIIVAAGLIVGIAASIANEGNNSIRLLVLQKESGALLGELLETSMLDGV